MKEVDKAIEKIDAAILKLKEAGQGRVFVVGTKVRYKDLFGIVTDMNGGSIDPEASTIDLRLEDGTTVEGVSVTSVALEFFRS